MTSRAPVTIETVPERGDGFGMIIQSMRNAWNGYVLDE